MITKELKMFDAAHRLLNYEGKCANLHGHTYKCQVIVNVTEKKLNKAGISIDFNLFKEIDNWIQENWDHACLVNKKDKNLISFLEQENNKYFIFDYNPTVENMVIYLKNNLHIISPKLCFFEIQFRIFENPNNCFMF